MTGFPNHKGNLWTTSEVEEVVSEAVAEERVSCLAAISPFPDAYHHLLETFERRVSKEREAEQE